jgi:hypothetical protein
VERGFKSFVANGGIRFSGNFYEIAAFWKEMFQAFGVSNTSQYMNLLEEQGPFMFDYMP